MLIEWTPIFNFEEQNGYVQDNLLLCMEWL